MKDLSDSERSELVRLRAFHAEHANRPCAECGRLFAPRSLLHTHYCSNACRKAVHKRRVQFGLRAYDAAMNWRIDRPEGAIAELGGIVDQFAAEERLIRAKRAQTVAEEKKRNGRMVEAGGKTLSGKAFAA